MKVLLVDDHPVVRSAVAALLKQEGFNVIGEATNGIMAISKVRDLKPELVILDIDLPLLDGLSVLKRVSTFPDRPRVLMLSAAKNPRIASRCLQAGAAGYVSKEGDLTELLNACKTLREGRTWFMVDALNSVREQDFTTGEADAVRQLSPRELNVLRCLARGESNMQIAEALLISNKTVSTYKTRLQQKLQTNSLIELADLAKRNGLI